LSIESVSSRVTRAKTICALGAMPTYGEGAGSEIPPLPAAIDVTCVP